MLGSEPNELSGRVVETLIARRIPGLSNHGS
jgi:hypothetical protein